MSLFNSNFLIYLLPVFSSEKCLKKFLEFIVIFYNSFFQRWLWGIFMKKSVVT